ncbi:MAG: transcriptional regulator [Deltaproteobacteria bacterium]|nr:MAG: transcriptional regulator [Deltaproteobacteria bacterium]RKX57468.1 MAG: ArsR family transcriptional regulator [Thermodesulfobacteriota bacterium]
MLEGLITSKTRIKLIMRFFLNPESTAYLRELAAEFGVSSNGVREELRHMEQAHLLLSEKKGRQVHFRANQSHPLFPDLKTMVHKALGINQILESILNRLGHLKAAYLIDDYALGRDTGIIDILLVGEIDPYHLTDLTRKTERYIERKIRTLVFSREEFERLGPEMLKRPHLRLWG